MTMTATATRISSDDGHLVARCEPCGQTLRHVEGFDADVALGTFFHVHPSSGEAVHQLDLPAGWRPAVAPAR